MNKDQLVKYLMLVESYTIEPYQSVEATYTCDKN